MVYRRIGNDRRVRNPPKNPWYRATAENSPEMPLRGNLQGGPNGSVHSARGDTLEGIMVQLIASNAVRTTVYSNQDGQYEFPKLPAGVYTLRIPRPLQFLPYQQDALKIDGPTALADIVLEPRYATDYLPPAPDILPQISNERWRSFVAAAGVPVYAWARFAIPLGPTKIARAKIAKSGPVSFPKVSSRKRR